MNSVLEKWHDKKCQNRTFLPDQFLFYGINAAFFLAHGSVNIEIHGGAGGSMTQNGRYGFAVNAFFQACRGKTMSHGMKIAILHMTVLQDGFEFFLNIAGFGTSFLTCEQVPVFGGFHFCQRRYQILGDGNFPCGRV